MVQECTASSQVYTASSEVERAAVYMCVTHARVRARTHTHCKLRSGAHPALRHRVAGRNGIERDGQQMKCLSRSRALCHAVTQMWP